MIDQVKLTKEEIKQIQELAREKLGSCQKGNDVIGVQIFSILGKYARVIYYPLGEDAPWGFTRVEKIMKTKKDGKPFAGINTSIPKDKQVFAAAHELYHIWFGSDVLEVVNSDVLGDCVENKELKANRFAAEFLIPKTLLRQEIDSYEITVYNEKTILKLAELFVVPFRTMVKRLREVELISEEEQTKFLAYTDADIAKYRKIYSFEEPKADSTIAIDNLTELAVKAYELHQITYEKFQYLLKFCKLTPEEVGINPPEIYSPLTDDELDAIMAEDEDD